MKTKTYTAIILTLLITGLFAPFSIKPVNADETYNVTISDSSVNPEPQIFSKDGSTYTVTCNFTGSIKVTTSNIVIDGADYTMQNSGSIGVWLSSVTNVTIVNLKIKGGTNAIYSNSASSCLIANNTITNVSKGVTTDGGGIEYCNITGNSVSQCATGIYLMNGNGHNRITSNNFTCSEYGIELFSSDNTAVDNFIRGTNNYGFYIYKNGGISNTIIHDNTVFCYAGCAIYLSSSTGAQVYHNNFIAPTGYSISGTSANSWNNDTYGNYFSSADHTDANEDGFVDSALTLASNNVDNHPLSHYFGLNVINMTIIGSGTTNRISGLNYERENDHVVITQTPMNDGEFYNWILDDENVTSNTIAVTMDTNHSVTAVFKQVYYTLTVVQPFDGAVCVSGNSSNLINGTQVIQGISTTLDVQALPVEGTQFYCWLLDGQQSTSNPLTVTFNGNHTLQALFIAETANLLPSGSDWPMIMGDAAHTGNTASSGALSSAKLWSFEAPAAIRSSPAIVDGIVYFGTDNGYIYAVNEASGRQVWNYSLSGSAITTSPAISDGKVFVGTGRYMYALDVTNGELLWNVSIGTWGVATSPVVDNGRVFVGVGEDIYAFDATSPDGEPLWIFNDGGPAISNPVVSNGILYFPAGPNIFAINATTTNSLGEQLWTYTLPFTACPSLTVADGLVIAGDNAGNVYAFDATVDNDTPLWTYDSGDNAPMLAVANGIVYVAREGMMSDVITALNATTTNPAGEELWGQMGMFESPYAAPIIANDIVYLGLGGRIYAYNATSSISEGNPQQKWSDMSMTVKSPMAVADGILFATTNEKILYAYATSTKVVFTQTGLPTGASWSITLDGTTLTSTLHSITFGVLQTGSHSYSVAVPDGYVSNVTAGTLDVAASTLFTNISYNTPTYNVTFTETGLAAGTEWNITLDGTTQTSTTNTITFTDYPNGEYAYTAGVPTNYTANTTSDTITIADANVTQTIAFTGIVTITDPTTNTTYEIQVGGNVTIDQFANMTLTQNQGNQTTVLSFTLTVPSGEEAVCNLTLPKTAVSLGTTPTVYIDGVAAEDQSYVEDDENYYVSFTAQESTHEIEILFNSETEPTPTSTPTSTATPTPSPITPSTPTPSPSPPSTATPAPTINPTVTPKSTLASLTPYFTALLVIILLSAAVYCMVQRKKHQATKA